MLGVGWELDEKEVKITCVTIRFTEGGLPWRWCAFKFQEDVIKKGGKFDIKLIEVTAKEADGVRTTWLGLEMS